MRRLVLLLALAGLLAITGSAAPNARQSLLTSAIPGEPYAGSALQLTPTTAESKYNSTIGSARVRPSAGKRRGFKTGLTGSSRFPW